MPGEMRFDGQVAVVTGAQGDVGRQYALELTRRGARVAVNELGWVGMEVAHYRATPAFEIDYAGQTYHGFTLFIQPPDQYAIRFAGVTRQIPPSAGSIIFVPA